MYSFRNLSVDVEISTLKMTVIALKATAVVEGKQTDGRLIHREEDDDDNDVKF